MLFQSVSHNARSRRVMAFVSTLTLVSYSGTFLGTSALGQTSQSDKTETPERAKKDDLDRKKKELPPAPGNPAVLVDPTTGSGNNTKDYLKDGTRRAKPELPYDYGDHKRRPDDPRAVTDPQDLPLYGYNYFEQNRRAIEISRRGIERMLGGYDDTLPARKKTINGRAAQDGVKRDKNGRIIPVKDRFGNYVNMDDARAMRDSEDDGTSGSGAKTRRRTNREGMDTAGDDNADDNSRVAKIRRRATSDDTSAGDDTSDDTTNGTRRRARRNSDDSTNDDNGNDTTTRRRSTRGSDTNADDDTDADVRRRARQNDEDSTDEALSDADLRENHLREQLGLPPLKTTRKTTRRSSNDDSTDDGYDTSSSRNSRNMRANSRDTLNFGTDYLAQSSANRPAANAFNQIISPLTQFTTNVIASAPTNYQLSGGDQVVVHISTPKLPPRDLTRLVDATGFLDLGDMGRFVVRGKTLDQLQNDLQQRTNRFYKNADVSVSLKELRTIPVTVQGEAVAPGTYSLPATITAYNLLSQAGGPTEDGSMREIRVMRQGRLAGTLDLYKFFLPQVGQVQNDIPLQSGDVIVVPPNGTRVAIYGEIRKAAQFELKPNETLKDALAFAGGVKAAGVDQIIQLNTIEPGQNRVLKNVNLRETAVVAALKLYDGDTVEIHSLRQIVDNKVTVKGAVTQPSDYALTPGMRVADLLRMARNPISEAYLGRASLLRWNSDNTTTLIPIDLARALDGDPANNLPLMKWDSLEVYSQAEASFVGTRKIEVRGAVQRAGIYEYSQNMRISDILLKAGGTLPNAERIEIIHQHGDGTFGLDPVLIADVTHGDKARDVVLQDNDVVAVYTNRQAAFQSDHLVRIEGDVNTPGFYPRAEGMKLSDLLRISGNFKPGANPKVVVAHARRSVDSPDNNTIVSVQFDSRQQCAAQDDIRMEDGDVVAVQGTGGIEDRPAVVRIIGAVNTPGPIILKNKRQRLSDAIAEAGGLRPEAFPEGAEFNRDPQNLNSKTQRALALDVSELNSLLNDSETNGARAKSDIDRIKALGSADTSGSLIGGSTGTSVGNTAAGQAIAQELSKHSLVTPPRRLTDKELDPSGNIAINLPAALDEAKRHVAGVDDILLKDGDTIIVPETPTTIQVIGAVTNQRGVLYSPNKPLEFYVAQAGGFTPDSAKDRIVVIHAGGGIIPAKKARELRPGDVILVPTKVLVQKVSENRNGFGDFFRSLTSSAILFKVSTGLLGL